MEDYQKKVDEYLIFAKLPYSDAVSYLLAKYGPATDNYFVERSYERFLNGEVKNPAHGKYSRTSDGLYTHHIQENKYQNMAVSEFIKAYQYPFELQKQDQLLYCDLFEHLILHAIITHETDGAMGYGGYSVFLLPKVIDWYGKGLLPSKKWEQAIYQRSFLTKDGMITVARYLEKYLIPNE